MRLAFENHEISRACVLLFPHTYCQPCQQLPVKSFSFCLRNSIQNGEWQVKRLSHTLQKWQKPQPSLMGLSTGYIPTRYIWLSLNPRDPVDKTKTQYPNPLHLFEPNPLHPVDKNKMQYSIIVVVTLHLGLGYSQG